MNKCKNIELKIIENDISKEVIEHIQECKECKSFLEDYKTFTAIKVGETNSLPPAHIEEKILNIAQKEINKNNIKHFKAFLATAASVAIIGSLLLFEHKNRAETHQTNIIINTQQQSNVTQVAPNDFLEDNIIENEIASVDEEIDETYQNLLSEQPDENLF